MRLYGVSLLVLTYTLTVLNLSVATVSADDYGPNDYFASIERSNYSDWMSKLSDDKFLSDLSIPGTHDSMAVWGNFKDQPPTPDGLTMDITKLQQRFNENGADSLARQLQAGIRAIDIRVAFRENKMENDPIESPQLAIHHGIIYQQSSFYDVMRVTSQFLKRHHREVLLMRLKLEIGSTSEIESFPHVLSKYLDSKPYGKVFYKPSISGKGSIRIPKLGSVRGKVVLMILDNKNGIYKNFGIKDDLIEIQDHYKLAAFDCTNQKLTYVARHLTNAQTPANRKKLFINFVSGTANFGFLPGVRQYGPSSLARDVNRKVWMYLSNDFADQPRTGILMFDYPGWKLIDLIIFFN